MPTNQRSPYKILLLILVLAFLLRTYRITNPIADWHAFRQADTASVTREFVKYGVNLLQPRYHDLSNIQSGHDNPEGYRMVELPLINGLIAAVIRLIPQLPLVLFSRFVSLLFSLASLIYLYLLVNKISDSKTALLTSLVFAVLPYSIYYSRAILPEPFMLFFSLFSLYYYLRWLNQKKAYWLILSTLGLSLALLLKPFVIFLIPVYIALVIHQSKSKKKIILNLVISGVLLTIALLPFAWWRWWIQHFPEGIPVSDWLFNGNGIRFRPAWFRWLFYERLTKLILGYSGIFFLLLNLINKQRDRLVYGAWWLGILIYFSVVASGNVQHDYYQVLAIPIISISVARGIITGWTWINQPKKPLPKKGLQGLLVVTSLLSLFLAWQQVKGYFNVNHWEYVRAGEIVDQLTPPGAKIIAPAMGDTIFLFQTNRRGWPIGFEIEDKIQMGATHYVTTSLDDEANQLLNLYQIIAQNEEYLLLDLTKPLDQQIK